MKLWRLTIRQLMWIVLACSLGFTLLRNISESLESETTFLAIVASSYFVCPLAARRFARTRLIFWDWFAITGLLYLGLSQGMWGVPPGDLPTTQWLDSQAMKWFPPHIVHMPNQIYGGDEAAPRRDALLFWGQVIFSFFFALYGAFCSRYLFRHHKRKHNEDPLPL